MPIKINSTGGGSVSIDVPSTGGTYTLTAPANNATIFTTDGGAITGNVGFSGAVSFSSNNVSIGGQTASPFGAKNKIINGAMMIDQRYSGVANTNSTNSTQTYVLDRWMNQNYTNSGTYTIQQMNSANSSVSNYESGSAPAGFINSMKVTVGTANTNPTSTSSMGIGQAIEGLNIADLGFGTSSAKTVTLSFWVKSSITGQFATVLYNYDGSRIYNTAVTINSANTWEYKTFIVPGDTTGTWLTNTSAGMWFKIYLTLGSSYLTSSTAWNSSSYYGLTGQTNFMGTSGNTFYITGVQLEVGTVATPFEYRQYGTELALCQRYYYKEIPSVVNTYFSGCGLFYNSTSLLVLRAYPVTMRAIPTFSQTGTASHYGIQYGGGSQTCNSVPALNGGSIDSSWVTFYGTGFTAGQAGFGFNTGANQGYLAFSSEY